jgi:hypothetical protein
MDERYRFIYERIYEATVLPTVHLVELRELGMLPDPESGPSDPDRDVIQDALAAAELIVPLREDAKALLALNFKHMVTLPLRLGGQIPDGAISEAVRADMRTIVGGATQTDLMVPVGVSGHGIIDSLSRNWHKLQISRFNLWENNG